MQSLAGLTLLRPISRGHADTFKKERKYVISLIESLPIANKVKIGGKKGIQARIGGSSPHGGGT